ncbi:hypothetical protein ENSA7_59980 [Enhygromyxa salina]|uniref:Uncharacterized protein n=1 Tax=Enhygromyxa salina TaxID=215803 RepID=A0A2S9Y5Y2_9BACT|nr:hypothetical protein ENSA7_59980 [Enhygromyxa salina]
MKLIAKADPDHPPVSVHRLEPETVALLAELAADEVERLRETHDPARLFDQISTIHLEWRGRQLELEPRLTRSHRLLFEAIGSPSSPRMPTLRVSPSTSSPTPRSSVAMATCSVS